MMTVQIGDWWGQRTDNEVKRAGLTEGLYRRGQVEPAKSGASGGWQSDWAMR